MLIYGRKTTGSRKLAEFQDVSPVLLCAAAPPTVGTEICSSFPKTAGILFAFWSTATDNAGWCCSSPMKEKNV